jgi:hypothetical protein
VEIDPHAKSTIDYIIDQQERRASRRAWIVWLIILGVSLCCMYLFIHDVVSGWLGITIGIAGAVGAFLFLMFLSTKPYGHSDFSFRWWWLR